MPRKWHRSCDNVTIVKGSAKVVRFLCDVIGFVQNMVTYGYNVMLKLNKVENVTEAMEKDK